MSHARLDHECDPSTMSACELLQAAQSHLCQAQALFDEYATRTGLNDDIEAGEVRTLTCRKGLADDEHTAI